MNTNNAEIKIYPVTENCKQIYLKKEHVLIGISPFNSYFSQRNIEKLIAWGKENFQKMHFLVPDKLSFYTLLDLGYTQERAKKKTTRQSNYLRNKIRRAFKNINISDNEISEIMLPIEKIENEPSYKKIYNTCLDKFNSDNSFKNYCLSSSLSVVSHHREYHNVSDEQPYFAVKYFLAELPFFLDSPYILDISSSVFVYHIIPDYIKALYKKDFCHMISKQQGFLGVKFNDE